MREGRRENGAGMGKETLPVLFALIIRSFLGGQGLPKSPLPSLPGSPRAWQLCVPRRGAEGRGCSEELCTSTPRHRQGVPRGHDAQAGWYPPCAPRSNWRREKRRRSPLLRPAKHAPHMESTAFGLTILPHRQRAMPWAGTGW